MLHNAQPRFAYDSEDDTILDYATSKSYPATGKIDLVDGEWDLDLLKDLLKKQLPIFGAWSGARDKVETSNAHFINDNDPPPFSEPVSGHSTSPTGPTE